MHPVVAANRLAIIVKHPAWGGGLHRDHLGELLGCDRRTLDQAIAIAYRRHAVDICWGWIVAPASPAASERAA